MVHLLLLAEAGSIAAAISLRLQIMQETHPNANANADNHNQYFIPRSIRFNLLAVCICVTLLAPILGH
jgi:hypothetical protein